MKTIILSIIGLLILLHIFDIKEDKLTHNINTLLINTIKQTNPLSTYKVWTYIELENTPKQIQLLNESMELPVYFRKCIDRINFKVNVLHPYNIHEYLPEFSIPMGKSSPLSLKKRVDLLFAHILENYGGLCISPGTIAYDLTEPLREIYLHDIVTFGSSTPVSASQSDLYPDTYIIGSPKGSEIIKKYKEKLLNDTFRNSSDILSECLIEGEYNNKYYSSKTVGTHDNMMNKLTVDDYLNKQPIHFQNKKEHLAITIPYNQLINNNEYAWFLNLSEEQLNQSNLEIVRLLNE